MIVTQFYASEKGKLSLICNLIPHIFICSHTLNPSSPGFSGSKSYMAVQCGPLGRCWTIGVLAGERIGDGNGDAVRNDNQTNKIIVLPY